MAESTRQQIFAANFERLALGILRPDGHKLRPQHVSSKTRNREAALFLSHLALRVNNLGIRQHDPRSEEHTSELQSPDHLVSRLLLEKKTKRSSRGICQCSFRMGYR